MENLYTVIKEKTSLKRFCYKNGYKLEKIVSERRANIDSVSRFLASQGISFASESSDYKGYHIQVSEGGIFRRIMSYFFNLFSEDSSVIIRLKDSFVIEEELPFSLY